MADEPIGPYQIPKIASDDPVQRVRFFDALAIAINTALAKVRGEAVSDAGAYTDEQVATRETPEGAQAKADAAESGAIEAAAQDAADKYRPITRGSLPDGADLNTLIGAQHVGAYSLLGSSTYLNAPSFSGTGVLEVERGPGNALSVLHRITASELLIWREAIDTATDRWSEWVQAETTTGAQSKADAAERDAAAYTDQQVATRETPTGAQGKIDTALTSAKGYTDEQIATRETPTGAQSKATAALTSAKEYTDAEITKDRTRLGTIETKNTEQDTRLDGRILTAGTDFHAVTENGLHKMTSFPTDWQAQNMPVATRGILSVETFGTGRVLIYKTYESTPRIFKQALVGSNWGAWTDLEAKNAEQDLRLNGRVLAADADLHAITENGLHKMQAFPTNWQTQNMPTSARGTVEVETFGGGRILLYKTYEANPRIFKQTLFGGTWGPWADLDAGLAAVRDGIQLTVNTDLLSLSPGRYQIVFFPKAGDNAPELGTRGALAIKTLTADGSAKVLEFTTYEAVPRMFAGSTSGGAWNGWTQIGMQPEIPKFHDQPGSGAKTVPLNVTIGGASTTDAPLAGTFRYPMKWHAPILRVRVCIQNVAPITGTTKPGPVDVTGLWVGKHGGGGAFSAAPRLVQGSFSTPADGSAFRSRWIWLDQTPGVEDLLSLGYTAANGTVYSSIANGWKSSDPADAAATVPGLAATATMPFYVWLEAETYSTTPVIACFGDSLSSGVSAGGPMFSWLSQYCERVKALPRHHSNSGDTMQSWASNLESFKWHVFDGLAKPDALIWAMGSNDLFADSISLEQAQGYFAALYPVLADRVSPNIYLANIMPRTAATGANEVKRRAYNEWLTGLPFGARDLFNFRDAISSDDETIRPEYDADGVHLKPAGYGALAAAITRPVTAPPVAYQQV